jgi:hypothetical protein
VSASWSGLTESCSSAAASSGHFSVLADAVDAGGVLQRLAIDFEADCTGLARTLGSIRYNNTIALRL